MADPLTLECGHPRVLRWADESGEVRLWACEDCRRRFYPACPECVDVGHRDETHPDAARAVPSGLDAAWAEAEAALPEGWRLTVQRTDEDFDTWSAAAVSPAFFEGENDDDYADGQGPTPAAALRALTAALAAKENDHE